MHLQFRDLFLFHRDIQDLIPGISSRLSVTLKHGTYSGQVSTPRKGEPGELRLSERLQVPWLARDAAERARNRHCFLRGLSCCLQRQHSGVKEKTALISTAMS